MPLSRGVQSARNGALPSESQFLPATGYNARSIRLEWNTAMRQIALTCGILIVLLIATVGCLYIFEVMTLESAGSAVTKYGSAIVLLGACAAAITFLLGRRKDHPE